MRNAIIVVITTLFISSCTKRLDLAFNNDLITKYNLKDDKAISLQLYNYDEITLTFVRLLNYDKVAVNPNGDIEVSVPIKITVPRGTKFIVDEIDLSSRKATIRATTEDDCGFKLTVEATGHYVFQASQNQMETCGAIYKISQGSKYYVKLIEKKPKVKFKGIDKKR